MSRPGWTSQAIALVMMVAALVAVIALKGQCARAVGGFFETLDEPARSAPPAAR